MRKTDNLMSSYRRYFLLAVAFMMSVTIAVGQVTTSGMNGKITGTNGESLPGATVVAVHVPSGTQYGAITDIDGNFRLVNLRIGGPYTLTVSFVGYKSSSKTDIYLNLGQTQALNFVMNEETSQLSGIEVVASKNALIDGNRTGASTNISTELIESLPSINRSITDFTRLNPLANGNSFASSDGRYNNITVDGANLNNNFGLSTKPLPGGDAQPISLDAIDEISVNIAPFDIRQSNFTGANITAVTRSGDNTFKGSAYSYYRDKSFNGKKVEDNTLSLTDQSTLGYGVRIGGPIIKNKLFFFANVERETSSYPGIAWEPSTDGVGDADNFISRTSVTDLQSMKDSLIKKYGYDPGDYQGFGNFESKNYKLLAKIDWNIDKHNRFTLRYNYVNSTNDQQVNPTSAPGTRSTFGRIGEKSMSFSNANYGFLNTVGSISAELNSVWTKTANKLLITYTKIRDTRSSNSADFPFVDIYKDGDPYMSFGYELFTKDNDVRNNVLTFTDNFNYYLNKHTLTFGASYEFLYFGNSYKRYGTSYYRYASMVDFYNNAAPTTFGITYPYGDGDGYAELNFGNLSVYGQDEIQVNNKLRLTAGLRLEMPTYLDNPSPNPAIEELEFKNLDDEALTIDVGNWPKAKVSVSPRVSFNYDAKGDKTLQIRGGTGIFSGRLPFVWFTNQPSNSGVLQNTVEITKAYQLSAISFSPDPFYNLRLDSLFSATPSSKAPGAIAVVDKDFVMPQVWRNNLAVDYQLPWQNMVLTLEGIFTKDIKAIVQYNANLSATDTTFQGADNRVRYLSNRINSGISSAMVLSNAKNGGYAYSLTVQLSKSTSKGLYGFIAYTYSGAKDLTANPGSTASSAWGSNPSYVNQNDPGLSFSQFNVPSRVVASLSYRKEYLNHLGTTVSLFFSGSSQGRLDYIYSNDMNGDGNAADLMFIPKDESEIQFADITKKDDEGNVVVVFSAAEQMEAFWKYVDQDKYLNNHKGEYAERYGVLMPWLNRWDIRILQDVFTNIGKSKHSLQISLDLLNFGNLLSSNWGVAKKQVLGTYDITLLKYSKADNNGAPVYQMNYTGSSLPSETFVPVLSTTSTWGAQIGLRYTF
ncbi:MAG: TonB-dependent receptor [Bacteroidota bacterium]